MEVKFWLVVLALTVACYLLRYILRKAANAGRDAVSNAHKRKKNQTSPEQEENLLDRYR